MSMDYDEYAYDQAMLDLYEEHKNVAIEEFTKERLVSYYQENNELAKSAISFLGDAKYLIDPNKNAAFIFSAIAMEVGLKAILLKPVIYGLVHNVTVADLITSLTMSHNGINRYRDLLFRILESHAKINFNEYKRSGSPILLWKEIEIIQTKRNYVMHRAESVTVDEASNAIGVASEILETIFPDLIKEFGFHLHNGYRICNDWKCQYKGTPLEDFGKNA